MQQRTARPTRMQPVIPVRAAIYARVSSEQQAERHTIDSQLNELLVRASADGHDVNDEFRFI